MDIKEKLKNCLIKDVFFFQKQYQRILQLDDVALKEEKLLQLQERISLSSLQCETRNNHLPKLIYPDLPIVEQKDKILKALAENSVIIVAGETGSGKTTQLPKICLEAGLGVRGFIGHTQPRRIAARNVSMRIAFELESALGSVVGYKVRFSDNTSDDSYIKVMTDGILLSETQTDKWLSRYDCIIIDEAHERSLNIDFLLGYLKNLLTKRKDLKVIITSATIDVERFSKFYNNAPLISISGRTYGVEVNYLGEEQDLEKDDPTVKVLHAVEMAYERGGGDILIFQSGEKEIREVCEVLSKRKLPNTVILPLFARQSVSDQQKAFQTSSHRRIIVTTNVAETSITVPNIRFVIDSGVARMSRYNYRTKLQRLPIEAISQASCEQRKGRCGRIGPGICYRLYTEEDYLGRSQFTEPEILRTNLAGVILKMLSLGLKDIAAFPFLDPPDSRYVKDAFTLLERLEAVDENDKITPLGRQLAQLPIEPKLGRMIIAAKSYSALKEVLIIVSALSIVDPRERPAEQREKADLVHAKFNHEQSDFMSFLNLWKFVYEHKIELSHNKFRKLCKENMLSFMRVCEWFDVHQQLQEMVRELGFKFNQVEADYSAIHHALLTGLIDSIGHKLEKTEYEGARNIKFYINPGSVLFKKSPAWVMALEIVNTSKTYARINATIETKWIEVVGKNLLKKQYFEPHFDMKEQRVTAFEKSTLFGLEIVARRKVSFENISPLKAREIFIQQGLVEQLVKSNSEFYQKNKATLQILQGIENRVRKHPIADEIRIFRFYDQVIPKEICSTQSLDKFLENQSQHFLIFKPDDICVDFNDENINKDFPLCLFIKEQRFKLEYVFDMSSNQDGVTLTVPIEALAVLKEEDFSWLIPGLLDDKIEVILKGLPKKLRLQLSPIPEHVAKARKEIVQANGTFDEALLRYITNQTKIPCGIADLQNTSLPPYLKLHFKVVEKGGKILGEGDSLSLLFNHLKQEHQLSFQQGHDLERKNILLWDFGDLPDETMVKKGQHHFQYYPALVDNQQDVSISLFETKGLADFHHPFGLARLYLLQLNDHIKQFKKNIAQQKKTFAKLCLPMGEFDQIIIDILFAACYELFVVPNKAVKTYTAFEKEFSEKRAQFILMANQIFVLVTKMMTMYPVVLNTLRKYQGQKEYDLALKDIEEQLKNLLSPHFVKSVPLMWLKRFPIYLEAIIQRLDKLSRQVTRDKEGMVEVKAVQKVYLNKLAKTNIALLDHHAPLLTFKWKIEELRVSLFAQTLGTLEPVSKVRLLKVLEKL